MTDFCHQTNDVINIGAGPLPTSWRNISGLNKGTKAELKTFGWLPVVYVNKVFNPATQVRTGPTGASIGDAVPAGADSVTGTYTLRAKTAQELAADQRNQDLSGLREAGKDLALVLTELIQWTLANTAMQATDFSPSVRQAYLDLKAIADRVKT